MPSNLIFILSDQNGVLLEHISFEVKNKCTL